MAKDNYIKLKSNPSATLGDTIIKSKFKSEFNHLILYFYPEWHIK